MFFLEKLNDVIVVISEIKWLVQTNEVTPCTYKHFLSAAVSKLISSAPFSICFEHVFYVFAPWDRQHYQ